MAADLGAVGELDDLVVVLHAHAGDGLRPEQLGAEALGLGQGAAGELRAAEAVGKAQVVFDGRALAGLAAGRAALDHQRAQPFGRAINGRAQAGGAGAHDDEIVEGRAGAGAQPDFFGQLGGGGLEQVAAVGHQDDGQVGDGALKLFEQHAGLIAGLDVEPVIRDLIAGQEIFQVVGLGRPAVADDAHALERRAEDGQPVVQQLLEDRVQALLGRVPGLSR